MSVIDLVADVQLKAATLQFASEYARISIMTTHCFLRGYGQNSVEPKIK